MLPGERSNTGVMGGAMFVSALGPIWEVELMTESPGPSVAAPGPPAMDPVAVIRSKPYIVALLLAAALGIPISAVAYGFLAAVTKIQQWLFADLPNDVFTGGIPAWWPVPWLV